MPPPPSRPETKTIDARGIYASVHAVIDERAIWTAFQPIVRLDTRQVVAYEALSRGPAGTPWQHPVTLFAAAREAGRSGELDWVCRTRAYEAALHAGFSDDLVLFVNGEPAALREACPADIAPVLAGAAGRLRIVTELTERDLAEDPTVLITAAGSRATTWCMAFHDRYVDDAPLAMMPLIDPCFLKVDSRLLNHPDRRAAARVVNAVITHSERADATIIAEGLETEAQVERARAMGATLGQGWLFGHPVPLKPPLPIPRGPLIRLRAPARPFAAQSSTAQSSTAHVDPVMDGPNRLTPYQIVTADRTPSRVTKRTLLAASHCLEAKAADAIEAPVLLTGVQDRRYLTARTARRYRELAETARFVAVCGVGLDTSPAPGVHALAIPSAHPLRHEWSVIVIGPYFSAALVALDLGDGGAEPYRRFDYALTYDRALVLRAARAFMRQLDGGQPRP